MSPEFDIVAAARACAQCLAQAGHDAWARRINDAIDSASTGGELVMALRWNFRALLREEDSTSDVVKTEIARVLRAIDDTGW